MENKILQMSVRGGCVVLQIDEWSLALTAEQAESLADELRESAIDAYSQIAEYVPDGQAN